MEPQVDPIGQHGTIRTLDASDGPWAATDAHSCISKHIQNPADSIETSLAERQEPMTHKQSQKLEQFMQSNLTERHNDSHTGKHSSHKHLSCTSGTSSTIG